MHGRHLPPQWKSKLIPRSGPDITDASRNRMDTIGLLPLLVRDSDLRAQVLFLVTTNLAASCILGTFFIDGNGLEILPPKRAVLLHHSRPITLLKSKYGSSVPDNQRTLEHDTARKTPSTMLRVTPQAVIPPMSKVCAIVTTKASGLSFVKPHYRTALHFRPVLLYQRSIFG
eukprot:gb/GEZJ01003936.1/.p1 GENE.gb/GEZJ01003936.1/~~gb/GEZJ01003936.1/.p1  ORF type:complete len:172 (-),score=2.65 gb/GEZJ01003936.1/:2632-3147(-)